MSPAPHRQQDEFFGGGFVSDDDRVSLHSLLFAAPTSRGAGEARRTLSRLPQPSSAMAAAAPSLMRTLSTPRSSVDTNQARVACCAAGRAWF